MPTTLDATAENERVAKQIRLETRSNPRSPYAGKFVGLVNGQIVVIAATLSEASDRLTELEPDHTRCYCVDTNADYDRIDEIWGDL